ncbi:MAG: ABC transporter substrate-binding protein [Betaproteobacteria bacterium]|nr:ABC transporter substrate-binding protein [Betaproteobacteria bacterium]
MQTFRYLWHLVIGALCGLFITGGIAHAQKVIRIGAPLELTGKFVIYGSQAQRGMEMAVEAFAGTVAGHRIEVLLRDIQSTNQGAVSAMTDLLEKEKVDFLIGPIASGLVSAAVPAWRQQKPLWIVPGASALSFEEAIAGEAMVFHTYAWGYGYHTGPANALAAAFGKGKKVAIIYSDGAYGRSHLPDARKHYTEAGFQIVATELVRENAADMNPALQKIRLTKPDVLVCLMQTTDGIVVAKQIHVAKLGIPILVASAFPQFQTWADAVGEAANGWITAVSYLAGQALPADPKYPKIFPAAKDWEAAFRKKYSREPELIDAMVYTSAAMLFLAIDRAGGGDKERVAKELRNLGVQTIMGEGKFVPTPGGAVNQAFNEMFVIQRQGDKIVTVWPKARSNGQFKPIQ